MVLAFAAATGSQVAKQTFLADEVLDKLQGSPRFLTEMQAPARRGSIYSADGKPLAQSVDAYELTLLYDKVPRSPGFFMALSAVTGLSEAELSHPARSDVGVRVWSRPMRADQAEAIEGLRRAWMADGVSLRRVLRRDYPMAEVTSGVVGKVREGRGLTGLELSQNAALAGSDGAVLGFVDREGAFVEKGGRGSPRRHGSHLTLTIDSELQLAATQALRTAVESNRAERGVAVVIDPSNGDILAMANWPSFSPDDPRAGGATNPVWMDALEPGSTSKPLTLAMALESGAATPGMTVFCPGILKITEGRSIRCHTFDQGRGHGVVDNQKAIAVSCNVAASTWALRMGYDQMAEWIERFRLVEKTELGLPLERRGLFSNSPYGRRIRLATVGFGQSITTTPIRLASALGALANGGVLVEPRLIKAVDGQEIPVQEGKQVVRAEVADQVMEVMKAVIHADYGTGARLRIPGYTLAGKTGTAEKTDPVTGEVGKGGFIANFVGYVPGVRPRAVVLVMVDNPKVAHYGGVVAGPVFREIAQTFIRRHNIPPDEVMRPELEVEVSAKMASDAGGPSRTASPVRP